MTYADVFRRHQELVQAHLKGKSEESAPFLPSFFPPASYWTSSEKDLFFHGLTVHSRLRPDLIAEHIRTKSTFDVCVYLDALEAATLRGSNTSKGMDRSTIEPAMEVSERWIQCEEEYATTLSALDTCSWSIDDAEKDAFRAPSRSSCTSFEQRVESSGSNLEKKDGQEYWGLLDSTCLVVLESIIREADTDYVGPEAPSTTRADSQPLATVASVEETLPEVQRGSRALSEYPDQPMLSYPDEALLEIAPEKPVQDIFQIASRNEIRRRLRKRLYMRRKRAEQSGITIISNSLKLRPGRLKRSRKPSKPRPTTYNTKKKLALRASSECSRVSDTTAPKTARSVSVDSGEDQDLTYEPRSQGGATKHYRVKKFFQEHGVDAQALVDMDLNLFHLSTLARLLRLYTSIHEPTTDMDHVSISVDVIQLLVSITTGFVSEIIRRAVITKEQEIRQKRELKVWKYDRHEITAENMTECLNSMGLCDLGKEMYFARLLGEGQSEQETASIREANIGVGEENRQNGLSGGTAQPFEFTLPQSLLWCALPTHRRLFTTDDLLPEEIHQTELRREIEQEQKLNLEDEKNSKEFEKSLWDWQANVLQKDLKSGNRS